MKIVVRKFCKLEAVVLLRDLEVTSRIILKYVLMKLDANMCKYRIYEPPNRD
jgi:hypothetical protein